jgi:hypothetical protein
LSGAPSDGYLPNLIFIGERDVSHARLIALAAKKETGARVSFNHSSPQME